MKNPWETSTLSDYESHMKLDSVMQLQTLNSIMKEQLYQYPIKTVMILGVSGGNGLEHIHPQKIKKVYGVDINSSYLEACIARYPNLKGVLECLRMDLRNEHLLLPSAELVIANLLIEYLGYTCFQHVIQQIAPIYVSCVIQLDIDSGFISESPYRHVFDCLDSIHFQADVNSLSKAMEDIGYLLECNAKHTLPNGKVLLRLDFCRSAVKL